VTVLEYASGMVSGYLLGSVTDVPRLLFRRVDDVHAAGGWNQVTGRFVRLHNKSLRWGSRYQSSVCSSDDALSFLCESNLLLNSWAAISATCGGMNVAFRALRGGADDEWNTVLGSMAAGALFRRKGSSWISRGCDSLLCCQFNA
jgi:hypothetical protein